MAEEMENEDTGSKSKFKYTREKHNANQRRWANNIKQQLAENFAEADRNGTDVWLTIKNRKDPDQCIRASEIKEWGLSCMPEVQRAKKGDPGYYVDKIL